jgi:hypothetical protein
MHAEVLPLAHALNKLLERLSEFLDRGSPFTVDAAHELTTPPRDRANHRWYSLRCPSGTAVVSGPFPLHRYRASVTSESEREGGSMALRFPVETS